MIHLHNHSEYSFLDGYSSAEEIAERAVEIGHKAIAITDHGNLCGVIEFYNACKERGIKPIIGCEVYVTPDRNIKVKVDSDGNATPMYHITLLAMNDTGYKNLIQIVTDANLVGFYNKPRTDVTVLQEHSDGLIVLSGCIQGEIPQAILSDNMDRAEEIAREYQTIFPDRFFLELQANTMIEQRVINDALKELGETLNIPTVVTCDAHYPQQEDSTIHDLILCIGTKKPVNDPNRLRFPSDDFYLMTEEDVRKTVDCDESIRNTHRIADMVDLQLEFGNYLLPEFTVPEGYDANSYLAKLCMEGLFHLIQRKEIDAETYLTRLEHELETIQAKGLSTYVLIVWDFVEWARRQGIMVGPGRGSAVGSLINYIIGITKVDPIEHDLLFERFINVERTSLPDIDVDFCYNNRHRVVEYLTNKYGQDKVASVVTFGSLMVRSALSTVGSALGLDIKVRQAITRAIPGEAGITLDHAIRTEAALEAYSKQYPQLFAMAAKIEGRKRHQSTHASGFVISPTPLIDITALKLSDGSKGNIVTQFEMDTLGSIGMVKFDLLGLKILTAVQDAARMANIDIDNISLDDKKTLQLFNSGNLLGIFQLEKGWVGAETKDLGPEHFGHITDIVSLIRPGPRNSGETEKYIMRKRRFAPIEYAHPDLEEILSTTYGVLVYQEQVMKIAGKFAGYTPADQDHFRAAIGKKNAVALQKELDVFAERAMERGYDKPIIDRICEQIMKHAHYSFGKSHAAAYAYLAFQTAYLKAHHPLEYMTCIASAHIGNTVKVGVYLNHCRNIGIPILRPDINHSGALFRAEQGSIRYSLANIKGIGAKATQEIISKQPYTSLADFYERVDRRIINKNVFTALIYAGAFDEFELNKQRALAQYYELRKQHYNDKIVPSFTRIPKKELMQIEKRYLGIFIGEHPLDKHDPGDWPDSTYGQRLKVAGIITETLETVTKKGENMCRLTLDTPNGIVEAVVYPDSYEAYKHILIPDNQLIITAKRQKSDIATISIKRVPGGIYHDQSKCTVSTGAEVSGG